MRLGRSYLLLHLVFISYFKIVANRNKDLINNRNQVNFLKTFFCKRKKRSFVTFHIRATHATPVDSFIKFKNRSILLF